MREAKQDLWYSREFNDANFADDRLNRRLILLAKTLSEHPLSPINQACKDSMEAKAAYRFFSSKKTSLENILHTHQVHVRERSAGEKLIYVVQDGSSLDFTNHIRTTGLGSIGTPGKRKAKIKNQGLGMHTGLALTAEGFPLGIISQHFWARPFEVDYQRRKNLWRVPIEEKETFHWIKCMRESVELFRKDRADSPTIIQIGDRGADIFEFMEATIQEEAHFIIRGVQIRRPVVREGRKIWRENAKARAYFTTEDALKKTPLKGNLWIEVPRCPPQNNSVEIASRIAEVEIRAVAVKIAPPKKLMKLRRENGPFSEIHLFEQRSREASLDVNLIWLKEIYPPAGTEPLEWFIYTDLPVDSIEVATKIIDAYKLRWRIELLHKIMKSGCRVEDCRLSTAERLKKYITLSSIIAWRILWMTYLNRKDPGSSSASFLTKTEWVALHCRIHETNVPPKKPPTVHQALHWIARLGGFLDRKSDGEPGMVTIWRGWQRLTDIAEDWEIFHSRKRYG